MQGAATQAMPERIVEERQRRRCRAPRAAAARRTRCRCAAGTRRAHGGCGRPMLLLGQAPRMVRL